MILAVTTAEREIPTLKYCIKCIRKAGWKDKIYIFAEPGNINIDSDNITIFINDTKLGGFSNYDKVLNWFIKQEDENILILQDDLVCCKNMFSIINKINLKDKYGYYNMLSVKQYPLMESIMKVEGWNKVDTGWDSWGAAYLLNREVIKNMLSHDFYKKHKEGKTNRAIDACISECFRQMKLAMYQHNPSLVQHIGYISTLEHTGILTGYKFKMNYGDKL